LRLYRSTRTVNEIRGEDSTDSAATTFNEKWVRGGPEILFTKSGPDIVKTVIVKRQSAHAYGC
jgi:hypothetical protein